MVLLPYCYRMEWVFEAKGMTPPSQLENSAVSLTNENKFAGSS